MKERKRITMIENMRPAIKPLRTYPKKPPKYANWEPPILKEDMRTVASCGVSLPKKEVETIVVKE